jgi:hypothetical protein
MANTIRDAGRETFWRRTLAGHEKSGLTVREFCRQERLRESAFYFWRRTIRDRGLQHSGRTRRVAKRPGRKPPAFVPLVLGGVAAAAGIALELRGGRTLRLSESFPPERLAGLILGVRSANPSGRAHSAAEYARLKDFYRQAEEYGAGGIKRLENGRFRFYGEMKPARTPGEMAGLTKVREWDPVTGNTRTWFETLDQQGVVRQVRPETGGPKVHYVFDADGNYVGTR